MEDFLSTHHAEIIARAQEKIARRIAPRPTLMNGVKTSTCGLKGKI